MSEIRTSDLLRVRQKVVGSAQHRTDARPRPRDTHEPAYVWLHHARPTHLTPNALGRFSHVVSSRRRSGERGLSAAGLTDAQITETHRVHEHAAPAIIRASKPA